MLTAVSYIPYDKSLRGGNGDIIMFAQFEEGGLLSENRHGTESGNEYYDD